MSFELHEAVLREDVELVERLSKNLEENSKKILSVLLPLNSCSASRKKKCIEILSTHVPKQIQVIPHKETALKHFDEKGFEDFFQISYAPTLFFQNTPPCKK